MIILEQKITRYLQTNLIQPYIEWLKETKYPINVEVLHENKVYKNIITDNQGINPSINSGKWLLNGLDNAYAAIDLNSSTSTVIDDDIDHIKLEFAAVNYTHLAFGSVQGSMLTVEQYNSSGALLISEDYPIGLDRTNAVNWYDYYFLPIPDREGIGNGLPIDILLDNLKPTVAKIIVKVERNAAGDAFIGSMVGGQGIHIGDTQYGVTLRLIDYSTKETDTFGITTLVRRKSRQQMTCETVTPAKQTQGAKKVVRENLGKALMIIADPETDSKFENLIILGYIEEFETYFDNGVISRSLIKIEEVL